MAAWFQFPFVFGVPLLPARRVIAIDPGARSIKVVLTELFLNRTRFLRRASIPTHEPGQAENIPALRERLRGVLADFGPYPIAVALPQHVTLSQVIDLPPVAEAAVERMIQMETFKLAGLSQTKMAYDYCGLLPVGKHTHSFWLTLCQESEVTLVVERLALIRDDVCDLTSAANALRCAYLDLFPATGQTVLADIGLRSTSVAILFEGQGVYAGSIALGTEMFAETLASVKGLSHEEAERQLREKNFLEGPGALPAFRSAVAGWREELVRVLQDWILENPGLRLGTESFEFVLSGGGAAIPGLYDYLNRTQRLPHFSLWPETPSTPLGIPPGHYAIADGMAIQALGKTPQKASLLPVDLRAAWQQARAVQRVQSISFFLLLLVSVVLTLGTLQKVALGERKERLMREAEAALERIQQTREVTAAVGAEYLRLQPLLERQKLTLDTLQALNVMQQARSNRNLWFVLMADDQSYLSSSAGMSTNEFTAIEGTGLAASSLPAGSLAAAASTNRATIRSGFIAEVCIPEEGDALRRTLSQLVSDLKGSPSFRNVDTVPAEQRRALANPKTIIPERHFALFMELTTNEFQFQAPAKPAKPALTPVPGGAPTAPVPSAQPAAPSFATP